MVSLELRQAHRRHYIGVIANTIIISIIIVLFLWIKNCPLLDNIFEMQRTPGVGGVGEIGGQAEGTCSLHC